MEPVLHLQGDHPWIAKVRSAERIAQIDEVMFVRQIGAGQLDRPALAKRLFGSKVERRVLRKMVRTIAIQKSRAIAHVARNPRTPRKRSREPHAQSVSLFMIQKEESRRRRRNAGQTARNPARAFRGLMRVRQMNVNLLEQLRSAHRNFRSCHPDRRDRQREKQVGIADHIVVEVVVRPGAEVVGIDSAAIDGNCDSHFVLLVALPAQENKTVARRVQDRLLQSVGNSIQRRRLIETAVRSSQHPLQARNLNRYTASRAGCGFRHQSCETCESYAAVDAQPLRYFELVFDENRFRSPFTTCRDGPKSTGIGGSVGSEAGWFPMSLSKVLSCWAKP